jgi:peroxiredoxin
MRVIEMIDIDDDYDNWEIKQHARVSKKRIGSIVPAVVFKTRVRDESVGGPNPYRWQDVNSYEYFGGKRIIVFSLPGAFTPTCSTMQLPGFETMYDEFKQKHDIDEIYCISVNDAFTMNAWAKAQDIKNVKVIPDGNNDFTSKMRMSVDKSNLGFGDRSWRYAMVVNNGVVEAWFEEPGYSNNCETDPYGETSPENIMNWLDNQ